jgi:hypothetical protein
MVGDRDGRLGVAEQRFETLLAFESAEFGERFALLFEKVEGEEEEFGRLILRAVAALEDGLQR